MDHKLKAKNILPKGNFLFAAWHGNVLGTTFAHAYTEPFLVMCSKSKDGDVAAYVTKKFQLIPVRGSSKKNGQDKGGKAAMEVFHQKMQEGYSGGITVDGPKGPREVCKPGIILIASMTGAPIIPLSAVTKPGSSWIFKKSWDQFQIPRPFAKIIIQYGEHLMIPKNITNDEVSKYTFILGEKLKANEKLALSHL
jgi:lysophospholipid acyltransferase (LPLAT)-like uncharacterized protein